MGQHYKEIAEIALKRRENAIGTDFLLPETALKNLPLNLTTVPRDSGHFTAEELTIIESNAEDILSNIRERKWTSLAVTKTFCKAAVVAQQLVCSFFPSLEDHPSDHENRPTASPRFCSRKLSPVPNSSTTTSQTPDK